MSGQIADCPPCAPRSSLRLLSRICRYTLGAFFLVAAVSKITDLNGFRDYLTVHAGLASSPAFAVAAVLPWLELVCGLCLVSGMAVREAAVLTAVLLVVFIVYGLVRPIESDCGCALWPAKLSPPPGRLWLLGRNFLLLACSFFTTYRTK
jgi:putative oxidoreductase